MRPLATALRVRPHYRHIPLVHSISALPKAFNFRHTSNMAEAKVDRTPSDGEEKLSPSDHRIYNSMAEHMEYFVRIIGGQSLEGACLFMSSILTSAPLGRCFTVHAQVAKDLRECL